MPARRQIVPTRRRYRPHGSRNRARLTDLWLWPLLLWPGGPDDRTDLVAGSEAIGSEKPMRIRTEISLDGGELTIFVAGSFGLEAATEFHNSYRLHRACKSFVVDFAETPSITSAGLANLVVMYQWAGDEKSSISIVNANTSVTEALEFAGFDRLLEIVTT